ncbi:hypothetical protein FOPE_05982 [Fonsecaea pedrosoi]|nr:hypothetical protein FOPE_05982 [Fonsecaea pedrosoi]
MPVIPLHEAQAFLDETDIVLVSRGAGENNYWPFFIVFGSIVGFALLTGLAGLISARYCSKRGDQKLIEKLAAEIDDTQQTHIVSASASSRSSLTLVEDPIVERRKANMAPANALAGREGKLYTERKRSRRTRARKSSSVALPVTLATLRKWAKRSTLSDDHSQRQPSNHARPISGLRSADPMPALPIPLHCKPRYQQSTSINYDEPSQLIEDMRSNSKHSIASWVETTGSRCRTKEDSSSSHEVGADRNNRGRRQ